MLMKYLKEIITLTAILDATSSEPYVEDSTVFWRLEVQDIGVLLRNISIPVTDLLVSLSLV